MDQNGSTLIQMDLTGSKWILMDQTESVTLPGAPDDDLGDDHDGFSDTLTILAMALTILGTP